MAVYESMKESGIEWIGKIPATWKTHTLYQLVTQVKNKNSDLSEQNLLSLSYGKIKRKDINSNGGLLPESFNGYNIIEDGNIVLRLTDLQNDHTSLRVGRVTERGIITSAYTTLRPIIKDSSKYLYYLLHCFDIKKGFYGMGSGVRQGLNYDEVKELRVIMPSSSTEQSAIAAYLDDQCAKIDTLISEAKASIEEYKKWKTSLIFEAVTKGLDPQSNMKPTNDFKIKSIPSEWNLIKFKYLLSVKSGEMIKAEDIEDSGPFPVYGGGERIGYCSSYNTEENTILIGRVGARCGCITCLSQKSWATDNALIVKCYANYKYLYYLLLAANLNDLNVSNAQPLITGTKIKNSYTAFTDDPKEQEKIVEYLDSKMIDIDSIIESKNALITDLELYKKSLIFETVTGKRKVV